MVGGKNIFKGELVLNKSHIFGTERVHIIPNCNTHRMLLPLIVSVYSMPEQGFL